MFQRFFWSCFSRLAAEVLWHALVGQEWLERNLSTKASHALRWSEDLTAELKQADRYRKVVQSLTSAGRPDEERVALLYFFCWSYATTEKPCCPLGCGDRCTCGYVGVFV